MWSSPRATCSKPDVGVGTLGQPPAGRGREVSRVSAQMPEARASVD